MPYLPLPPALVDLLIDALIVLHSALALGAAGHALLTLRDPRAAWGWIAACWLAPGAGFVLYLLLGTNRVRSRAQRLLSPAGSRRAQRQPRGLAPNLPEVIPQELRELVRIGGAMSHRPLEPGHDLSLLRNGEETYAAMLAAIDAARERVWMSSYIFATGTIGRRFAEYLERAQRRGVDVRVLIDGLGDLYYWPRGSRTLERRGLSVRRFQLLRRPFPLPHLNLRNHRKLLVVDGSLAFTGGINIGDHHLVESAKHPTQDLHVRIEGPVTAQLAQVFREDWAASGGGALPPELAPTSCATGPGYCRAITEGPNEEGDCLELVLLGALANAHRRVCVMTPYFIPTQELSRGMEAAALRGVTVEVILPERSNLPWVDWASRRWIAALLERGVLVHLQPAPFAHSKLLVVDGYYSHMGSANVDPRSLRLNFELVVETYDRPFAGRLQQHFDTVLARSRPLTLEELRSAGAVRRVRDALCWLFSPYL